MHNYFRSTVPIFYYYRCPRVWLIVCGFLMIQSASVHGQYPGYHPIAESSEFKKQFASESVKVLSITSNFTQEKTLTALTEKITSTGKFWFKRSNKVRIEYTKPYFYLLIMNGDKMMVRDDQKKNQINVNSNKLFQQVNRIIIDCVQGTILESRSFTTRIFENDKSLLLEMTPSSKALREFFQTVVLIIEKKDYSVRSIEMNEPMGDKTTILFMDKKLNEQISDEVFAL